MTSCFMRLANLGLHLCWLINCTIGLTLSTAHAQTPIRIDDSATIVTTISPMQWVTALPNGESRHLLQGRIQVQAKLNVQAWLGKPNVRIYMGLAPTPVTTLTATWQSQGRFLPGALRANAPRAMRTLIYQGPITQTHLEEVLLLTLTADGRTYSQTQPLHFFFEIDQP